MPSSPSLLEKTLSARYAEAAFLSVSCLVCVLYRGFELVGSVFTGVPEISHISFDGVYYAQIARNILSGDGLGWEAMVFPALQPVIVAGLAKLTGIINLAYLARWINLIAGSLTLIPTYYLGRELFGRVPAAATILLLIPFPHLLAISTADTAEALYSLLVMLSLYVSYIALTRYRPYLMALAGACFGLGYLARPEGLLIFAAFVPLAGWRLRSQYGNAKAAVGVVLAVVCFTILASPYAIFLTKSYGRPVLSSKLPYESIKMRDKVLNLPLTTADVYGLTPDGNIAWQEYGGAHLIWGYLRDYPSKMLSGYVRNFASELPWEVRNSTHMTGYPRVFPLVFWIPAILGFCAILLRRGSIWVSGLIMAPFVNMFVYPVFTDGFWVYHVPYVPIIVILATGGVFAVATRLGLGGRDIAAVFLLAIAGWWVYSAYTIANSKPRDIKQVDIRSIASEEAQSVGLDMRKVLGSDKTYMMRWSRLVYYIGGRWVEMPSVSSTRALDYARRKGVDYIVEERRGNEYMVPNRFEGVPGLIKVYSFGSQKTPYSVVFWKIRK